MCQDAALNHLHRLGYTALRLPRTSVTPLMVGARRRHSAELFGRIEPALASGAETAPTIRETTTAEVQGRRSSAHEAKVGVKFLEAFLKAVGLGGLGADVSLSDEVSVAFRYGPTTSRAARPAEIARWLAEALPNPADPLWQYMDEKHERGFLVSSVLLSKSFSIEFEDMSERKMDLDASAIRELVDVTLKLGGKKSDERTVTFEGRTPAVFAAKLHRLRVRRRDRTARFEFDQFAAAHDDVVLSAVTGGEPVAVSEQAEKIYKVLDRSEEVERDRAELFA